MTISRICQYFALPASLAALISCGKPAAVAQSETDAKAREETVGAPAAATPQPNDRVKFHAAPKPLPAGAVTEDWPRFLGANDNAISGETKLLSKFPESGPKMVWEMAKGTGYTSPAIVGGRLVMFDRIGDQETVDCLDPETGQRFWSFAYPVEYRDRYGYSDGPRASAVIDGGKVITLGVTGILTCLDLATGARVWQTDLRATHGAGDNFFGFGSCPVVFEGRVIVNVGGADQLCVAAFDRDTGKLVWGTKHEWSASYSSPVVKTLRGAPRLLVFAGGESDPASGGLLCIDPKTGVLNDAYPWRADKYESVNATTPVVIADDRVFVSDCYEKGGVMLELTADLKWKEAWKAPDFGMHWMTPLVKDGHLYAFRGRNEPDAWLACYDAASGAEKWREDLEWLMPMAGGRDYRMRFFRGSLLHADGKTFALGELGTLAIFDLTPTGVKVVDRAQLFVAQSTWSLPVLHRGLLYVSQHQDDVVDRSGPRLICYDLRGE